MKTIFWSVLLIAFITCLIGAFVCACKAPENGHWFVWLLVSSLFGACAGGIAMEEK